MQQHQTFITLMLSHIDIILIIIIFIQILLFIHIAKDISILAETLFMIGANGNIS